MKGRVTVEAPISMVGFTLTANREEVVLLFVKVPMKLFTASKPVEEKIW